MSNENFGALKIHTLIIKMYQVQDQIKYEF